MIAPVIFIDKFDVSGIEMMIPGWPSQEVASGSARLRQQENILISFPRAGPDLKALCGVDSFERPHNHECSCPRSAISDLTPPDWLGRGQHRPRLLGGILHSGNGCGC